MSLQALILAWRDLMRARVFGVVLTGIGLTLLLLVLLQSAIFWIIRWFAPDTITLPLIGEIGFGGYLSWSSLLLLPVFAVFLMAPVAAFFSGLFADRVADVVEHRHYPDHLGQPPDFWDGLLESAALMGVMLLVIVGSLLLTPFLGPLTPVLFYGANGWLLGREFFQLAARRHLSPERAHELRRDLSGQVTALGVMIALLLTVPVLNVVVPVLAAAGFTHLYHFSRTSPRYRRG